jgi:hypothetical protein
MILSNGGSLTKLIVFHRAVEFQFYKIVLDITIFGKLKNSHKKYKKIGAAKETYRRRDCTVYYRLEASSSGRKPIPPPPHVSRSPTAWSHIAQGPQPASAAAHRSPTSNCPHDRQRQAPRREREREDKFSVSSLSFVRQRVQARASRGGEMTHILS